MASNLELKVQANDLGAIEEKCRQMNLSPAWVDIQADTYFNARSGRLKVRRTVLNEDELIYYHRPNRTAEKLSHYWKVLLAGKGLDFTYVCRQAFGVKAHVVKRRKLFLFDNARVHLDTVFDLGALVEIEVPIYHRTTSEARALLLRLSKGLGVAGKKGTPLSNSELLTKRKRGRFVPQGRLLLVDGPSSSGKSTLVARLLETLPGLVSYVKRYTTRARRGADDRDYVHVTNEEFDRLVKSRQVFEHKHFLFGMSYGLSKKHADQVLRSGKVAVGIMNLGNIDEVRLVYPQSISVFIDADGSTLERRLQARGTHDEAQIAERLESARNASRLKSRYDFVISNNDGELETAFGRLVRLVRCLAPLGLLMEEVPGSGEWQSDE